MEKKDPYSGETFTPKRHNQRFANRSNQIAYNNMLAREKRKVFSKANSQLNKNREILRRLLIEGETNVSKEFLRGAGFNFLYFTQSFNKEGRQFHAVYDFLIEVLNGNQFIISKLNQNGSN